MAPVTGVSTCLALEGDGHKVNVRTLRRFSGLGTLTTQALPALYPQHPKCWLPSMPSHLWVAIERCRPAAVARASHRVPEEASKALMFLFHLALHALPVDPPTSPGLQFRLHSGIHPATAPYRPHLPASNVVVILQKVQGLHSWACTAACTCSSREGHPFLEAQTGLLDCIAHGPILQCRCICRGGVTVDCWL